MWKCTRRLFLELDEFWSTRPWSIEMVNRESDTVTNWQNQNMISNYATSTSLQCRHIFSGRKAACLSWYCCSRHLCFYDRATLGRVEIATLRVNARVKEGKGEEEGRKIPPSPYFLLSFGVSTSKKIRAQRKRLHCRLRLRPTTTPNFTEKTWCFTFWPRFTINLHSCAGPNVPF